LIHTLSYNGFLPFLLFTSRQYLTSVVNYTSCCPYITTRWMLRDPTPRQHLTRDKHVVNRIIQLNMLNNHLSVISKCEVDGHCNRGLWTWHSPPLGCLRRRF
ncbi:hypothetical protein BAE44_0014541, partial [Dichanthelium oligosanthes]